MNCHQPIADGKKFCTNCGCPANDPKFFDANALGTGFFDILTKKFWCFRGRAGRQEFCMFALFLTIIGYVLYALLPSIFAPRFVKIVSFVFFCGMLLPGTALTARRFHDTGRNGWVGASLEAVSWICGFRLTLMNMLTQEEANLLLLFIVPRMTVMVFACFPSQPGPNKYGPNPK